MHVVMLAAGLSSRMGNENKLLLPYNGNAMVDHCCLKAAEYLYDFSLRKAQGTTLVVVTGHMHSQVMSSLKLTERFLASHANVKLVNVYNENYEAGQFSSVKKGVSVLISQEDFFISLADMPLVDKSNYQCLEDQLQSHDAVRPFVSRDGSPLEPGHPVLISKRLIGHILQQPNDSSMREILASSDVVRPLFEDQSWICDVDFRSDYDRLSSSFSPSV